MHTTLDLSNIGEMSFNDRLAVAIPMSGTHPGGSVPDCKSASRIENEASGLPLNSPDQGFERVVGGSSGRPAESEQDSQVFGHADSYDGFT
jgi:hypothetical protein